MPAAHPYFEETINRFYFVLTHEHLWNNVETLRQAIVAAGLYANKSEKMPVYASLFRYIEMAKEERWKAIRDQLK